MPKVEALRRWCAEIGRDPAEIEWGLGVEPEDLDRFLREDADRYVDAGLHAVHARVQRAGLDGRPRPPTGWPGGTSGTCHVLAVAAG